MQKILINSNKNKKDFKRLILIECLIAAVLTISILWLVLFVEKHAPFGIRTLAAMDASIQYIDLFSWLKDVLTGQNNISYTFSKTLGGTGIGIFSYYLSSPFNILVLLFDKTDLNIFFALVVSLKLALASITCIIFLNLRFKDKFNNNLYQVIFVILLGISYGLSQYSISQASNIQWLDGVYMLPLILLGIYYLLRHNKFKLFTISIALSVLFNWYTAGINCLFSFVWLILELSLIKIENQEITFKQLFYKSLYFVFWLIIGLLISGFLFIPTIGSIQNTTRNSLSFDLMKNIGFIGNILSTISNYVPGALGDYGILALYCGSIPFLGYCAFFLNEKENKYKKYLYFTISLFLLLTFYWNPLYVIFSLFKYVGSYWYRYSYIAIIFMIFIAYEYLSNIKLQEITKQLFKITCGYAFLILLFNYINKKPTLRISMRAIILMILGALTIILCLKFLNKNNMKYKKIIILFITFSCILDHYFNAKEIVKVLHTRDVDNYQEYLTGTTKQINYIKDLDNSLYRISQTSTRRMDRSDIIGLTANYNEALVYNYWSISGYTSLPDANQLEFLNNLGYRQNSDNHTITNTSILAADSLLGVKYILSKYPIDGLILKDYEPQNDKYIFENPYYLPLVFAYNGNDNITKDIKDFNPFEYQNYIYSSLLDKDINLYIPLKFKATSQDKNNILYEIEIPEGEYAIYGNLPWTEGYLYDGLLNINDVLVTRYARKLSPSVFYIPSNGDDPQATRFVHLNANKEVEINGLEQFYALDLNLLKETVNELRKGQIDDYQITNGKASFKIDSNDYKNLFISIPYDSGWEIKINDKTIKPQLIDNCLLSIPLEKGLNNITMTYHVRYKYVGLFSTTLGIIILVYLDLKKKK